MRAGAIRLSPRAVPRGWPGRLLVAGSAALLPSLVSWSIFSYLFPSASLWALLPAFPNDEVGYWHQISTFKEAGFAGGYYTYQEVPAAWAFSHFGVHGPVFPILYGAVARVVGWTPSSGPIFNMALLATALLAAFRIGRLGPRAMLGLALLVSTSWWVLLMLPTTMQETLHQSIGIVLGALLGRLAIGRDVHAGRLLAAALVILVVASLMRPTWALLFGPTLLLALRPRRWPARAAILASTVPAMVAAWFLWRFISAPVTTGRVSWGALEELARFMEVRSLEDAWALSVALALRLLPTLIRNLAMIQGASRTSLAEHTLFLLHPHYQAIGFCLAISGLSLWRMLRRPSARSSDQVTDLLQIWNIGGLLLPMFFLAAPDSITSARALMGGLLLSLVVTIMAKSRRVLTAAVIASNVLMVGPGLEFYQAFRGPAVNVDREQVERFRQDVSPRIVFDPTKGPWCNTLDVTIEDYETPLIAIPPGIGITYLPDRDRMFDGLKARYLLLPSARLNATQPGSHLKHLSGHLYENLNAECDNGPPSVPAR
jgi:hypothetical protein